MVIGKYLNQGKYPIIEKVNPPKVVACLPFLYIEEVGKCIWVVRDWMDGRGLEPGEAPGCIFYPCEENSFKEPETKRGEVQWVLKVDPSAAPIPGFDTKLIHHYTNGNDWKIDSITLKHLSGERVLSTYHQGDTDDIAQSVANLERVLREEYYRQVGPRREIYRFDVHYPKSKWLTEIQIPVEAPA